LLAPAKSPEQFTSEMRQHVRRALAALELGERRLLVQRDFQADF